jgi:hypothetical protein
MTADRPVSCRDLNGRVADVDAVLTLPEVRQATGGIRIA